MMGGYLDREQGDEKHLTINLESDIFQNLGPQVTQAVSETMSRYEGLQFLCLG